jgi:hypothetical protein
MLEYFIGQVKRKVDTDFTQSMINCFLKTHYDMIMDDEDLIEKVNTIMNETEISFNDLESLIDHNLCMVSHFTGI